MDLKEMGNSYFHISPKQDASWVYNTTAWITQKTLNIDIFHYLEQISVNLSKIAVTL